MKADHMTVRRERSAEAVLDDLLQFRHARGPSEDVGEAAGILAASGCVAAQQSARISRLVVAITHP